METVFLFLCCVPSISARCWRREIKECSSCAASEHQPKAQHAGLSVTSDTVGTALWAEDTDKYFGLILLRMWVLGILLRMTADFLAGGTYVEPVLPGHQC